MVAPSYTITRDD